MANKEHLNILEQGVEVWNQWRMENPEIRPDLTKAKLDRLDLSGINLNNTHLRQASLEEANLTEAILIRANFSAVSLYKAHLDEANLLGANFLSATLYGANLRRTNLRFAQIIRANLQDVDFNEAEIGYTIFGDVDLSVARKLETIYHFGPSHIDTHTLYRSHGTIPTIFLQKAGVQDEFIRYLDRIKTPKCQYTEQMLEEWINSGGRKAQTLAKRIGHLENQKAVMGIKVDFQIVEDLDRAKTDLKDTQKQIKGWKQLKDVYY
jgi:hypothetical protein